MSQTIDLRKEFQKSQMSLPCKGSSPPSMVLIFLKWCSAVLKSSFLSSFTNLELKPTAHHVVYKAWNLNLRLTVQNLMHKADVISPSKTLWVFFVLFLALIILLKDMGTSFPSMQLSNYRSFMTHVLSPFAAWPPQYDSA